MQNVRSQIGRGASKDARQTEEQAQDRAKRRSRADLNFIVELQDGKENLDYE